MKTKIEEIPVTIFDYLQRSDFQSLSEHEKTEVQKYLSSTEFNDLHEGYLTASRFSPASQSIRKQTIKQNLLERFDAQHAVKPIRINYAHYFKNAAALVLFFFAGYLMNNILAGQNSSSEQVALTDTVYVTKESAPVTIYDTLVIERIVPGKQEEPSHLKFDFPADLSAMADGPGLPLDAIDSVPNRQKNNSLKDDSLLKRFTFVAI